MPQPLEVTLLADRLVGIYAAAQAAIDAEMLRLVDDPDRFARRISRLNELSENIAELARGAHADAVTILTPTMGGVFDLGTRDAIIRTDAARVAAGGTPADHTFTTVNRFAVAELTKGLEADLLKATTHTEETAKRTLRRLARESLIGQVVAGDPAGAAARKLRDRALGNGIHAVRYSNGARVNLGTYADMAIRTASALAYNMGTVAQAEAEDIHYMELFDGPGCGLTAHEDTRKASGMIVAIEVFRAYPIAHPNCRRSAGPRPDILAPGEKDDGSFGIPRTPVARSAPLGYTEASVAHQNTYPVSRGRERVVKRIEERDRRLAARRS